MKRTLALLALGGCLVTAAQAETQLDPVSWLGRIVAAAQKLNYTGTFIYQSGNHSETSRITHIVDGSGEREKLEVLDGSPREIIRNNEEVKCYLPQDKVVIIERRSQRKTFPALLPSAVTTLAEHYNIKKGEVSRVAGLDSQLIILEPKDKIRYGHMLWADVTSGLLLKARMVDDKNEPIEQFAFTQVQIGGHIDKAALKPKFAAQAADWRVQNAYTTEANMDDGEWRFRTEIPGFKKSIGMKRRVQNEAPEMTHVVFSDGLAAISVFIEPLSGKQAAQQSGLFSVGGINVYKRVTDDHALTVLGEVPAATLKRLGDGIEYRKKQ
ncbi:MAG: MucB/RseB C-terminal domain-containing protein [Pseudomonadota bacterium]|jgi:sigma-E factor negative regulatory protein RseB